MRHGVALSPSMRFVIDHSLGWLNPGRRHPRMIHMHMGVRRRDLAGQGLWARTRRRRLLANVPGQGFARAVKAAILNRLLYRIGARLARIERHGRRAGD